MWTWWPSWRSCPALPATGEGLVQADGHAMAGCAGRRAARPSGQPVGPEAVRLTRWRSIWDGSVVAGCTVGALLGEWAGGHPFNPSTLVGTATGSLLAATVFAFVARRRMQDR